MIFLNFFMLLGLAAIAIPILIHLLSRRKPVVVDWGAMRFLAASHQTRRRRIILEDLLLLCLRCMLFALAALAMARPYLLGQSALSWMLVLPLALAAVVGLVVALLAPAPRRRRWMGVALGLLAAALLISLLERLIQERRWLGQGDSEDIIVVLDASASMMARQDGRSNFERAREEAREIVQNAKPAAAIGLVLAGPVPRILAQPTTDREELLAALDAKTCRPSSGGMGTLEALSAAGDLLAKGRHPAKKIFLITDGQAVGWDVKNDTRWAFLAERFQRLPAAPKIVCRRLPFPSDYDNAAAAEIALGRKIVGTDRPVTIDVKLVNTGTRPLPPTRVELWADSRLIAEKQPGKELAPGEAEVLRFEHRFEQPGRRVLKARLPVADALPADNTIECVVDVLKTLPVLLVDGAPSERFFRGASAYTYLALALTAGTNIPAAGAATQTQARLAAPTVVTATGLPNLQDLSGYRVIILLNVPRLPAATVERLGAFVANGGGLLVAPGRRTEADEYNAWKAPDGKPLLPAKLVERREPAETPAHFNLPSFTHPALKLVAEAAGSDAAALLIKSYWALAPPEQDPQARVCGLLDNGDPALVERQAGKGYVLLSAAAFNNQDSNLAALKCFLPFVHELVYYLAEPMAHEVNIRPGANMILELPAGAPPLRRNQLDVATPFQQRRPAIVERVKGGTRVSFTETHEPGLYALLLPATNQAAGKAEALQPVELPFTVTRQPEESAYRPLAGTDYAMIQRRVDLIVADNRTDMLTALQGTAPGSELWKWLALGALGALLAETAVARWIAGRRQVAQALGAGLAAQAAARVPEGPRDLAGGRRSA